MKVLICAPLNHKDISQIKNEFPDYDCYEMTFVKYEFTFFNQGHWTGNFLI